MNHDYDVVVLGLGAIGSGAAYWLAKRGARVLGLEQFEFGHARAASHDHSRIIRLSYHAPNYVRLAKEAYAAWDAVERDSGTKLIYKTGGLYLGPRHGAIPLEDYAGSMRACHVPFEELDAHEIRRRFPQFRIADDVHGLFQSDTGLVAAERATATHQKLARELGATLLEHATAGAIQSFGGQIVVQSDHRRWTAGSLIVAAGPWTARALSHFDVSIPLETTKEQHMYFRSPLLHDFAIGRFPVWIWIDDPSFYGFTVFGEPAVKATQDAGGKRVDPDARDFESDPDITARVRAFLETHLPSALGPEHLVKTCLYTSPPDRDFILDSLPEHPNVHVAVGGGHGFKFASVIGRIFSDLVVDGTTASDISGFAIDRPILTTQSSPKTYRL